MAEGAGGGEVVGVVKKDIRVAEIPGGRTDEGLGLGVVEGKAMREVKVGEGARPIAGKKFVDENGMKWMQVFLGPKSTVPQEYGYQSWPSRWLIGPDGKVIAKDIVGVRLKIEIERALTK